ncbi:MAG: DUF1737 domain-containing protein [Terracoccus sp.]
MYRVLTGPDDENFCLRVSDSLELGYRLHGGPAITFDGQRVVVAQAVVWNPPVALGHAEPVTQPGSFPAESNPSRR